MRHALSTATASVALSLLIALSSVVKSVRVVFSLHHRRNGFVSMLVKWTRRTAMTTRRILLSRLTIEAVMKKLDSEDPTTLGSQGDMENVAYTYVRSVYKFCRFG